MNDIISTTMSNVQKALFDVSGSQVHIGFDFQKANEDTQRTVVGFATLDNIDQTGERVTAEASANAFRTFRGNIRTQHDKYNPVAVMKAFEPAEYINPATGEVHRGIRMAVKVADDDAWNKVVEGVYSGFSVGGIVTGSHEEWNKELGRSVKIITEYKLTEISLVDNPANELANFETVYKAFGFKEEELQKDFNDKNLFYCPKHGLGAKSSESRFTCASCGENMAKVGTISENENVTEKLTKVLNELEIDMKGVIPTMADEITKAADGAEEAKAEEVSTETEANNSEVEASAEAEAETQEEEAVDYDAKFTEITKQIADLQTALLAKVNDIDNSVQDKIDKAFEAKAEEIGELKKSLETTSGRVESIANATAMRKSEDSTQEQETLEKSADGSGEKDVWDGVFTGGYNLS